VHDADYVCLCRFPLTQFLCKEDIPTHQRKLSSSFIHRTVPLSLRDFLNTKEEFDTYLKRLGNFERMKHELGVIIERANQWNDQLTETSDVAISTVQGFQPAYKQTIENACQNLRDQANWAVQEVQKMLEIPGYLPQDDLTASCWVYISGQTDQFAPRLVLGDHENVLREYRFSVESLAQGLRDLNIGRERRDIEEMGRRLNAADNTIRGLNAQIEELGKLRGVNMEKEKTEAELRAALAAYETRLTHLNHTLEELRKSHDNELDLIEIEHHAELESIQRGLQGEREEMDRQWPTLLSHDQAWWSDLVSRINADTILCCLPYCILWPIAELSQRNSDVGINDILTLLFGTVLCCV
jgi:hypothetical protein